MDGPPAIRRRRRATKGVPLVPLPRASRRKDSSPLGYGYISSGRPKRKYDGFFPVLSSEVTSANRKKRKLIHDRWLGRIPDAPFTSPLEPGWVGFTDKEVEILKDHGVHKNDDADLEVSPGVKSGKPKTNFYHLKVSYLG